MKIIKDKLLPFYYRLMRRYGWAKVVEDNAGPHASYHNVQLWELLEIARMEWSFNSSDLNAMNPLDSRWKERQQSMAILRLQKS